MSHKVKARYFPDQPDVLDMGDRMKKLHSPYISQWHEDYGTWTAELRVVVPAGFVYNGASVPQLLWSFYPPHALDRAAVFHDFIYRNGGKLPIGCYQYRYSSNEEWRDFTATDWTRSAADRLFFNHLTQDPEGPGTFRRHAAWAAVRAFGGSRWG